jgi:hypothetical protein
MALNGCQAHAPQTPEDTGEMPYGKWQFAFFTPHALPADVTRALIIDSEDVVYTFGTLDRVPGYPGTIGTWNNRVRMHAHFNKARHPPAMMLFCWDSVIEKNVRDADCVSPLHPRHHDDANRERSLRQHGLVQNPADWSGTGRESPDMAAEQRSRR